MTYLPKTTIALCTVVSTLLCGCTLFAPRESELPSFGSRKPAAESTDNAPIRHVVRLQTATVTSRPSEARLRSLIWEELDESGPLPPEDRIRLNQSGIRVGVSGGTLPWALHGLMPQSASSSSGSGTGLVILEGNQSRIELPLKEDQIVIPPGQLAGLNKGGELGEAGCGFQVEPMEYADSWVVLKIVPELRYGAMTSRYSFNDDGGQVEKRQKLHPLYEQQFEVKLHVGESIVIGYHDNEDWTVGQMLMQSEQLTTVFENLVVLQLTGVESVKGEKSLTVDYQRHGF
ncbi:MAG: hypothetical protein ABJZ55_19460 [Fuerstiella sp.]